MANVAWEFSENGLDARSPKECLHIGSDGATIHFHNLTEEEREIVERYRYVLENVIWFKVTIEEAINDG